MSNLTPDIVERIVKGMPADEAAELLAMFDLIEERKRLEAARVDFWRLLPQLTRITSLERTYAGLATS